MVRLPPLSLAPRFVRACAPFLLALLIPATVAAQASTALPVLRIGVEGAYPPFSELGTDGKLKGFDIDVANEVCKRLKRRCELVQAEFDAMIPALRARKFDAIVASMSITPERLKAVDFSDKYYFTPARVVLRKGSTLVVSADGLKGQRIGVQRATIHDRFATATFKGAEIVRYGKQDEVYLDLVSGRLAASLQDSVAADLGFLRTPAGKDFEFRGPEYNDPAFFGVGAGIAMRKGDTALRDQINAALKAIRADGTYKKFNDRYFAYDIYGPETAPR
ncbi:MAG: ABC transporter substrate-binding protein [Rubrivivax sp.]|jgi:arginine/ornithine transport system substrate-binding protein|nr:ABC transporter substrate-binding protein [Rubrivivax sp.]